MPFFYYFCNIFFIAGIKKQICGLSRTWSFPTCQCAAPAAKMSVCCQESISMDKVRNVIIVVLLLFVPLWNTAANKTMYSWLIKKVADKPSALIMKMADRYVAKGKQGEAIVLYSVVSNRYREDMDEDGKNLCSLAHKSVGKIYYDEGNYVTALDEFINGVKISETCRRPVYAASLYNYIGNVYCIFLDYEKGIDYYLKAYELCRKYPERKTEHNILVNLTGMYTYLKDAAKAKKYYRLAEQTREKGNPVDEYMSGYTLSLIQVEDGFAYKAIERLKRLARFAAEKNIGPKYICFAYQEIYMAYDKLGRADSALAYMRLCDDFAHRHNLQHTFVSTLKSISEHYDKNGDVAMSNKYKSRYLDICDSIYNTREFDAVKNSLFTYEVNKTTKEMEELRASERERMQTLRLYRVIMAAVGVLALITALFLVVVYRQKRRIDRSYADLYNVNRNFIDTQEQLTERLRKLRETVADKDSQIEALKLRQDKQSEASSGPASDVVKYQTSSLTCEQSQALADAISNIMENTTEFCDCNFSLGMLASLVGSNSKYVSQVINDVFHKSFNDYVNPYRIHLACMRFADKENYDNLTMKAIAESVGFKSYTSFVNVFRKITGITPSIYQKMARRGAQCDGGGYE